jgi:F0F1-type ATP synthase delta subunit
MQIMDQLHINYDPVNYTYIGIGTASQRTKNLHEYTDDLNQLYPKFIQKTKGTIRIIHIDPAFAEDSHKKFINHFFVLHGFTYDTKNLKYVKQNNEVIIIPKMLEDRNDFLTEISLTIAKQNNKLVVQQYTGHELIKSFQEMYESLSDNERINVRSNILWDFTYGLDCSCWTKMTKYQPIVHGESFFNIVCMTEYEIRCFINYQPEIDEIIVNMYSIKYCEILDLHHVNYRRKMIGINNHICNSEYTQYANPSEIMKSLIQLIIPVIEILNKTLKISNEKQQEQLNTLKNYKSHDPYKWYTFMKSFYK